MRVELEASLFSEQSQHAHPLLLLSIFQVSMQREHIVLVSPGADVLYETWRATLTPTQREVVEVVMRRSLQAEGRGAVESMVVACGDSTDWSQEQPRIGPDDILSLLCEPLTLLVEHEVTDSNFLRAMVLHLEAEAFRSSLEKRRIKFRHGGGSDMRALIKAADPQSAHRTFAIFDSDALAPGIPSKESDAKVAACKKARVKHHRLLRRAIENYLPPDELDRVIPHSRTPSAKRMAVDAFRGLNAAQRAHYNLEKGFAGDRSRLNSQPLPEVDELFANLSVEVRKSLQDGFGEDVARHFRDGISEASRRRDGQAEEMEPLFRAILQWL